MHKWRGRRPRRTAQALLADAQLAAMTVDQLPVQAGATVVILERQPGL